jgi:hypothetical protein
MANAKNVRRRIQQTRCRSDCNPNSRFRGRPLTCLWRVHLENESNRRRTLETSNEREVLFVLKRRAAALA